MIVTALRLKKKKLMSKTPRGSKERVKLILVLFSISIIFFIDGKGKRDNMLNLNLPPLPHPFIERDSMLKKKKKR